MSLPQSKELLVVLQEADDVARRLDQPVTSAHLLLCLFTLRNRASAFLTNHQVSADRLLATLDREPNEKADLRPRILQRAEDVARSSGAEQITSLHLLVALSSFVDGAAYRLMSRVGVDMATIRNTALSYLTNGAGRRDRGPSTAELDLVAAQRLRHREEEVAPPRAAGQRTSTAPGSRSPGPRDETEAERTATRRRRRTSPPKDSSPTQSLARRLAESQQRQKAPASPIRRSDAPLPPTVTRSRGTTPARGNPAPPAAAPAAAPASGTPSPATATPADPSTSTAPAPAVAPAPEAQPRPTPRLPRGRFLLRAADYPTLCKFGRNLSLLAWDDSLDPVIGRDAEIAQLADILGKRRANNPVLVGDPGVGKTAIVEGLARVLVGREHAAAPPTLEGRILVEIDASRMISGTGVRGSFSERLQALKQEVARAEGRVIVFLDELHHWIGMGAGSDGAGDGASELKTALARGEFPCIGATTFDEYRRFIESDAAFERRFQQVRVLEPSPEDAIVILEGIRPEYEAHHGVPFATEALESAVRLTWRHMPERRLPDKAISILDLAGSRARRMGLSEVDRALVATLVAEQCGLPPEKLLMAERERFLTLESELMTRVIGHQRVIERVSHVLRRNYAGFVSGRPIGSFLFLGPTGVGKTEFAKALAHTLFHSEDAMVRVDMSEYMEAHSVSRLIGSPPGYVGHDAGGQLTEAIRQRPYQLVLLDELEKAHPDVLNLLIQLLDEGHLTDSRGRHIDFSHSIVVMTSNLGAEAALAAESPTARKVGFASPSAAPEDDAPPANDDVRRRDRALEAARPHLRPEIWNRLDEALVFLPLREEEVARIARLLLTRSSEKLLAERSIAFSFAPEVIDLLIASGGYDPEWGARPMRRAIERLVETPIAEGILSGEIEGPATLEVSVIDGAIAIAPLGAPLPKADPREAANP